MHRAVQPPDARDLSARRPLNRGWKHARLLAVLGGVSAVLALAGCGGNEGGQAGAGRQVEDVLGTVEVPTRAERVVADSVSTMAHLWSLGLVPVGAALPTGISPDYIGDGAGDVPNLVSDDGWTLNVEATLAKSPELIVATGADYNTENCERYKAATSTFCFTPGDDSEQGIEEALTEIATAVGREDAAVSAIAEYKKRKEALRKGIAAAGLAGQRVGIVRFDSGGFIGVRIDGAQHLLEDLGMRTPKWPPVGNSGYVELSLETLGTLNAADTLFITLDDDVVPEKVAAFSSPLWKRLKPVIDGQAHVVSAWNGSDVPQLNRILDEIEEKLVKPTSASG